MVSNKASTSKYDIYVLGVGLSANNKGLLKKIGVHVIDVRPHLPDATANNAHVSPAALVKFDIANIFQDMDKILYLDTDMIVLRDLSDLFNTDLENHYAAVMKDMAGTYEGCATRLGTKSYFNSGMMLLNLKKMRKDNIPEKLLDYKLHRDRGHFMDQDCLNVVFAENVIYVSPIYNWMAVNQMNYSPQEVMNFYGINNELNIDNVAIVHLTNRQKPWDYIHVWGHKLWVLYYKKSIIGNQKRQYKDKKVWFGFAHNSDEIALYLLGTKILRFKKTKPAK